jgi:hypothetical protein
MNLILMVWRFVLAMLFPPRRDGLSLAARTDGRMEHLPHDVWAWLLGERNDRPRRGLPRWLAPPGQRAQKATPRPDRTVTLPAKSPSANG